MDDTKNPTVLEAAREWYDAGGNPAPAREDGTKGPALDRWTERRKKRNQRKDLSKLFGTATGVGVFTGQVFKADNSGHEAYGIECFEFDSEAAYDAFLNGAEAAGLSDLIDRIRTGYEERTPSGGVHWFYFCETVEGNQKLAQEPTGELDDKGNPKVKTLIETRGHGGWVITDPSHGGVHPSGKPYVRTQGSPATVVHITTEERTALFTYARTFDRTPRKHAHDSTRSDTTGSTGQASRRVQKRFNELATWGGILTPHGWEFLGESNGVGEWRRPGAETSGKDATTNADGLNRLWVHSTSTTLDAGRYYTLFQAYAALNHGGDHAAAAVEIEAHWDEWTAASESTSEPQQPRFEFLSIEDYRKRPVPTYLIDGVTPTQSLTMTYGDFASFKSFIALDKALSIAAGIPWQEFKTKQGPTAYIIGEGGGQFLKRHDAWGKHHGIDNIPDFYMLADAPQLDTDRDLKALIVAVRALPEMPVFIVIDTLARTLSGNENQQEDMGRYVRAAAELQKMGAAVEVIHHAGKDGKYRGSSALPGAADTIIRLDRKGDSVRVRNEKMKDDEEFDDFTLSRRIITLSDPPSDPDTIDLNPVTSIVLTRDDAANVFHTLTTTQTMMLTVLFKAGEGGLTYGEWSKACGVSKSTFTDALRVLKAGKFVTPNDPFQTRRDARYKVTEEGRECVETQSEKGDENDV